MEEGNTNNCRIALTWLHCVCWEFDLVNTDQIHPKTWFRVQRTKNHTHTTHRSRIITHKNKEHRIKWFSTNLLVPTSTEKTSTELSLLLRSKCTRIRQLQITQMVNTFSLFTHLILSDRMNEDDTRTSSYILHLWVCYPFLVSRQYQQLVRTLLTCKWRGLLSIPKMPIFHAVLSKAW